MFNLSTYLKAANMATAKEIARNKALLRAMLDGIKEPKRVAGLDLSTSSPGFAIVYGRHDFHTEHLKVPKLDPTVHGLGHAQRLALVVQQAVALCKGSHSPADLVIIEAPFPGKGNYDGFKLAGAFETHMVTYGLGHIPVVWVATTQLKHYACGTVKDADKVQVALAARDRLGWQGHVNDESDALWLAFYGWALLGRPLIELPKSHTVTIETHLGTAVKATRSRKAAVA